MTSEGRGDTIAAIATALGEASLGVMRLSGPEAITIADRVFRAKGRPLREAEPYTVHYGWVVDPRTEAELDEALATVMRAPRSYTREDVAELSGHGGVVGVRRILEAALAAGARLAEPGEFTKRAFLNGRIDLAQAEAVLQLIRASHEAAHTATLQQLRGGLSTVIRALRQRLLTAQAHLEVSVDFPGEEHATWSMSRLAEELARVAREAQALVVAAERGRTRLEGCLTVICGRPNVGKSSVLNALLRRERAIVTAVPGTTRDTIEEVIYLEGIPVRLVDTAGITETVHPVELLGVQRSREAMQASQIALWVLDRSEPLQPQDLAVAELVRSREAIVALNKSDLPPRLSMDEMQQVVPNIPIVPVSARTRAGLETLEASLAVLVRQACSSESQSPLVTNLRHLEALRQAQGALDRAHAAVAAHASPELVVVDVREAVDQLGAITGETISDELLETIFAQFCIGK